MFTQIIRFRTLTKDPWIKTKTLTIIIRLQDVFGTFSTSLEDAFNAPC